MIFHVGLTFHLSAQNQASGDAELITQKVVLLVKSEISGPALQGIQKLDESLEKGGLVVSKTGVDIPESADYDVVKTPKAIVRQ